MLLASSYPLQSETKKPIGRKWSTDLNEESGFDLLIIFALKDEVIPIPLGIPSSSRNSDPRLLDFAE